jgi:hypothetical protein
MPNPKRKNKKRHWTATGKFQVIGLKPSWRYGTLSDVEDRNDRNFLINIAASAATNAINENKAMNIPLTVMEDGWVVKKTSEGQVLKVAQIDKKGRREMVLTKGAILHVKGN